MKNNSVILNNFLKVVAQFLEEYADRLIGEGIIRICSLKPQQFAELLQSLFGGASYYQSGFWIWEVSELPAVWIQTGNVNDPERYYLFLRGPKEELAEKIRQCNSSLNNHHGVDFWKIHDVEGSFIGYISVTDD